MKKFNLYLTRSCISSSSPEIAYRNSSINKFVILQSIFCSLFSFIRADNKRTSWIGNDPSLLDSGHLLCAGYNCDWLDHIPAFAGTRYHRRSSCSYLFIKKTGSKAERRRREERLLSINHECVPLISKLRLDRMFEANLSLLCYVNCIMKNT